LSVWIVRHPISTPTLRRLRHSLEDVSQHPSRSGPGHKPWSCSGCFGSKRLFLCASFALGCLSPSGRQHRADNHNQSCQALTRSKRSLLSAFRVVCHGRSFAINRIGSPSGGVGVPSTWPVMLQCRTIGYWVLFVALTAWKRAAPCFPASDPSDFGPLNHAPDGASPELFLFPVIDLRRRRGSELSMIQRR